MQPLISANEHTPVMTQEVIQSLQIESNGIYADATYGRGGHSSAILNHLDEKGHLFAFDCDSAAIRSAQKEHQNDSRIEAIHARFSQITLEIRRRSPEMQLSGIVADLGVSSPQLDNAERGFSFSNEGKLDMRFDQSVGTPASDWLHSANENEIAQTLATLGEERYARRIARAIIVQRARKKIASTRELSDLISGCVPSREKNKHPATRTFLAIRIHINRELQELTEFLPQCVQLLKKGGRLVVISFHSTEDRIVKRFMRDASIGSPGPQGLPFRSSEFRPTLKLIGKILKPTRLEVERNRRARSAVMRVAERIGESNA